MCAPRGAHSSCFPNARAKRRALKLSFPFCSANAGSAVYSGMPSKSYFMSY